MEGVRCLVECWADFGDLLSAKVIYHGPDVILSTGTEHIFVFSGQERRVKTVLQFESPVTSLALSADQCSVYALCENNLLYCTRFSPESSSFSAEQGDDPALSVVSRDSVLVKDGNVLSFTVAEDILITVSLQESFWSFHLYELPRCSTRSPVFQKRTGFQVPAVTGVAQNDVDLQARTSSAPTLTCIYPNSSPEGHACKRHPRLDPLLFRLLFGVDASLINSPIILCGLPDGRLVFFPLLLPALISSRVEQKPQIRIFYSLEQPVAFIGTSVIGDQGPQCLVVIGQNGRILLIRANQRSSVGKAADCSKNGRILLIRANQRSSVGKAADCRFVEHIVPGPVVCACVDGEHLYYSTATNLFSLSLSKTLTPLSSSSSSITAASEGDITRPGSAVCLNVCRVIALTELSISPAGSVQLLAVSLSGRLLQVTLPQDSNKANVSRLASSQAGQKIKDLLAGIGNVWERATVEKQQLELKNNTLKRLNHVLNICHLLLSCQKNDQEVCDRQPPISCQGAAKWSTLLQKDSLVLTCILENQSACVLDQGWTLCLQVQSSLSVSAGGSSRTYSFALMKLDCGQKAEVTLPLESDGDLFLPVQIHCSLVYTLQSLLNPEEYRQLSISDTSLSQLLTHTGCICLALNTLTLDWLDALRIGDPTQNGDHIPKQISTWKATRMLLSSRQIHTDEPVMPKAAPHTVAIHISSELLRDRLNLHDCSSAPLCISVLKWLLCGTSKTEGQEVVQSPVVCAKGPDRQAVRLLTKENGRILLIRANQRSSVGKAADCRFVEHIVPGPVVCACVDGEHLYYSTATNLFSLSLSKTLTPSSSSSSSITAASEGDITRPGSAVCLNVCRVIALTELSISPAGSVQLLAVSLSGRLLQVTLPQDSNKANVSRLASSQAGQKIKDLLAGIGNVWERATVEKQQLELKNNTVKRLNHVLNICHLLLSCPKNDQDVCDRQPPISCQGAAKWSTLLQKDSLVLTCILENQSACVLDQGWTLCLQVQSSLSVSAGGSSRTYSFALMKLDCGQKAEVTLPLESDGDLFLPVQIHCSLVYTLQSLLNPEEYRQLSISDTSLSQLLTHTGCICLALNTLTLDWLDALRIGDPTQNGDHIPKQISTWKATRMLLSSRQIHTDEPVMPKAAPHTVAIHISSELLRDRLNLHDCSSAPLCISVLKWLLCGTSKTEGQEVVQSPVVCAKGPDRQAVRLLTKEVILSDFRSEGPLSVVEVHVESVSMSAVCGLHHAVLRRVQALLKDAAVKHEKPAELRGQRLCEAVRHMERLYKDLQDFRDPADGVMKTKRTSESLFHLYLQLREKPLVIL
ncbi:hypothetical protein PGIGA_G00038220 [Pangasianodon gigas]|uniref:Uncharacterized protein n=1 Tax=Pangasianodon gigas TaxID=30993 RepID=A0ACC5WZH1_PANGG|nr:hypothetical protein [Pangasianodon gigas]